MKITIDTQKDSKKDIQKAINFLKTFTSNNQVNTNFDLPNTNHQDNDDDEGGIFGAFEESNKKDDDEPKIEIVNF